MVTSENFVDSIHPNLAREFPAEKQLHTQVAVVACTRSMRNAAVPAPYSLHVVFETSSAAEYPLKHVGK